MPLPSRLVSWRGLGWIGGGPGCSFSAEVARAAAAATTQIAESINVTDAAVKHRLAATWHLGQVGKGGGGATVAGEREEALTSQIDAGVGFEWYP